MSPGTLRRRPTLGGVDLGLPALERLDLGAPHDRPVAGIERSGWDSTRRGVHVGRDEATGEGGVAEALQVHRQKAISEATSLQRNA